MKHIVLWGAWYGSHNVGDQVLLLTIMDILTQAVGDVRFTVLTNNSQHVANYTRTESKCRVNAVHNCKQFLRLLQSLAGCDLFIFGGDVPFYEERSHVLAMALMAGIARVARTPYMTWTVSSQEVQDPFAKRVFGWVVNGARAITYRDENTHQLFITCGVNRPMQLSGDSGFWLESAEAGKAEALLTRYGLQESSRPLVALTPRTLRGRDGEAEMHYNPKTEAQIEKSIACFTAVLDWLWEHGYQPVMVPMNTVAPDDDRFAARQVMERAVYGRYATLIDEEIRPRSAANLQTMPGQFCGSRAWQYHFDGRSMPDDDVCVCSEACRDYGFDGDGRLRAARNGCYARKSGGFDGRFACEAQHITTGDARTPGSPAQGGAHPGAICRPNPGFAAGSCRPGH